MIHSDVSDLYLPSCSRAKYYVTFFGDYDKTSKVILFSSQNGILSAFDLFWKRNQFGKARIQSFYTDKEGKYNSHAFEDYWEELCII